MALFTRTPLSGAPLGGPIRYAVAGSEPQTFDLRLYEADTRTPLGARRFAGVAAFECDVAPLLRRAVRFTPTTGPTGLREATGRTIAVVAEAAGSVDAPVAASSRTFLPSARATEAPALLGPMPRERLLAPGECDELTLLHDGALVVTVVATGGGAERVRTYRTATGGLSLFRLAADDFPGAERIEVDAGACGRVGYTLLPAPEGSQRLAWRTAEGSIEHYTFPTVVCETLTVAKRRARGAEGHVAVATGRERRLHLRSACEGRAATEALAGLLEACEAWSCAGEEYRPVDIVTDRATLHRHGALGTLEVEIRFTREEPLPWS